MLVSSMPTLDILSLTHRVTETRLGEGCEIGIRDKDNVLFAVITHPMPRAKWFIRWGYAPYCRPITCKTKKAALQLVLDTVVKMKAG